MELCLKLHPSWWLVPLPHLCDGCPQVWSWYLCVPTDERLQDNIMNEAVLILHVKWWVAQNMATLLLFVQKTANIYSVDHLKGSISCSNCCVYLQLSEHFHPLSPDLVHNCRDIHNSLLSCLLKSNVDCDQSTSPAHTSTAKEPCHISC